MAQLLRKPLILTLAMMASVPGQPASADVIQFQASDFTLNPTFSDVQNFTFTIDLAGLLVPGMTYTNPPLVSVHYQVNGTLDGTPSGFPAFNLVRSMDGDEFYGQGSSFTFEIKADAVLSDGLQVSDLVGAGLVFLFNAREVDTGRYHPPKFELNADGSGLIQNSNNMGGINPATMEEVDVDFGDEYITELSFNPDSLTLAERTGVLIEQGFETPSQ